ncbi:MAG: DUF2027 domain-containing protein [Bacteroidales bacterium]
MAKVGDMVRFMNAVGGGRIVKIVGNIAYVDEDGFETPVLVKECVVIMEQKRTTAYETPKEPEPSKYVEPEPELPIEETAEGDILNIQLAYQPTDIKNLSKSEFNTYLVNDSNYYLYYAYLSSADGEEWITRNHGIIEPNIQIHLENISYSKLPEMERVAIQYIPFKSDKAFELKSPVIVEHKLDATKFYKLHSFQANDYFTAGVIGLTITKDDIPHRKLAVNPRQLEDGIRQKLYQERQQPTKQRIEKQQRTIRDSKIIECDLHIHELLDNTAGLSNADMLEVQLKEFNRVMTLHKGKRGTKIVFIHGKGEGVLRKAIIDELRKRYSRCTSQDASFREYGFGATLVTIH